MKVAILSESGADEAGLRVLLDALLEVSTESIALKLRSRGWPSVLQVLPKVLLHLHFHTDATGFVVVVDSNASPLKIGAEEERVPVSRMEQLRAPIREFRRRHPERPGQPLLDVAVGVAAPSIEAWYLCGRDPGASEAAWLREMQGGKRPRERISAMKRSVYGTDRPSLSQEVELAVGEARRVAGDLGLLEQCFPVGFGSLAKSIRGWQMDR